MPETLPENEDFLLVNAVVRGDKDSFRLLIDKYEKLVVSISFKMVRHQEDCEDLSQEIFLKVYEKLHTFKFQSRLSTWIASITFNTCINFLKKKKLIRQEDLQMVNDSSSEDERNQNIVIDPERKPDEQLLDKERAEVISRSIDNLPLIQKTIINLFHTNELSLIEISEITALPVNTVKSHLFRARKHLKQELDKY